MIPRCSTNGTNCLKEALFFVFFIRSLLEVSRMLSEYLLMTLLLSGELRICTRRVCSYICLRGLRFSSMIQLAFDRRRH